MSGHSHAANIKRKKEATDTKKGSSFSKVAHLITVAVKESGGITDPEKNPRLKAALEKARAVNMPKANIQRAIGRGTGGVADQLEAITFEGFGPAGSAVIVECITDNKNRTTSEIRNLFERVGGRLAEPGAAGHFFEWKGWLKIKKEDNVEEQILALIDLGVEDVEEEGGFLSVYVPLKSLPEFKDKIEKSKFVVAKTDQAMKAKTKLLVESRFSEKIRQFLETLKAQENVERVFVNV